MKPINRNLTLWLNAADAKALDDVRRHARKPTLSAAVRHAVLRHLPLAAELEQAQTALCKTQRDLANLREQAGRMLDAQAEIRLLLDAPLASMPK